MEIFRDLDSEFVAIYDTNQTSELTVVFSLTWIENDITSELIFFYCGTHLTLESMFRIFSIMMTRMRMMMTYSWWRRYSKKDIRNQVAPVLYASIQSVHLFSKLLFRFSISSSLMDSFVRNHFTGGSWTVPYAPAHFLSIFFLFTSPRFRLWIIDNVPFSNAVEPYLIYSVFMCIQVSWDISGLVDFFFFFFFFLWNCLLF